MKRFNIFLVLLLIVVALVIVACSASAAPAQNQAILTPAIDLPTQPPSVQVASSAPGEETTLRVGLAFLSSPPAPPRGGFQSVKMGLAETLFRLGKEFKSDPWLATVSQQLDEKTWEITLRPDVKFHNGTSMDAAAVKASLEWTIDQDKGIAALLDIATIEVKNPSTIVIATNGPSPILPGLLTDPKTAIIDATAAVAMGDAFTEMPVLTGPFKVVEFQANKELIGVRHSEYWGSGPAADRVVFTYLPDNNSRVLALQGGDIDIASYVSPPSVETLKDDPDLVVNPTVARATLVFMHLNQNKPAWNDSRVRQAVSLAIDRNALVRAVIRGQGIPATGPFPPSFLACDGLRGHSFDPSQARDLLAEAGYKDQDGDGVLESNGRPLEMTLLTYRQRPELPVLAEAIQAMLKPVGIAVNIQMVERISASLREDNWDGAMYFNNVVVTGDPYGTLFNFFDTEGSANFGGYSSNQMDELIEQLALLADRDERRRLACDASQTIVDDVAVVPLLYPNFNYGVSQDIVGFEEPFPYHAYIMDAGIGKR